MKAFRETVALCALVYIVARVAFQYSSLPQRIPTHWGLTGAVNSWGDKSSLWALVALACFLYLLLTVIRFAPASSFSVPVSGEQRAAAIPVALEMIGWLKAEILCLFAFIVRTILTAAEGHGFRMSPWLLPISLIVIFGTVAFHLARMRNVAAMNEATP